MKSIRVAIVPQGDIFKAQINSEANVSISDGLELEFLNILSQELKRQLHIVISNDRKWGKCKNRSWTGVLGLIDRGEADIAVGGLTLIEERTAALEHTYPYDIDELSFGTRLPQTLRWATESILAPFTKGTWAAFLILIVFMSFIMRFLLSTKHSLPQVLYKLFGSLLYQDFLVASKKIRDRVLVIFWTFGAMIISYVYVALFFSLMSVPGKENTVSTVAQLEKAASDPRFRCRTALGLGSLDHIVRPNEELTRNIRKCLGISYSDLALPANKHGIVDFLSSGRAAVIGKHKDLRYINGDEIFISKDSFGLIMTGIFVRRNFPLKNKLNKLIKRILYFGLYMKSVSHYRFLQQLEITRSEQGVAHVWDPLEFSHLYGPFILLSAGYTLGILIYLLECLFEKFSNGKSVRLNVRK